jgi:CRISPR/Cas system-associated protein Cas10 (large subunit of type III CRISPR-Cas system)
MSDSDPNELKEEEKQAGQVREGALKALEGSDRFTAQEREEIASTIEAEVAKLLPELPEGIADIAFKALGLSLDIADKIVGQPQHPSADEPSPGDE